LVPYLTRPKHSIDDFRSLAHLTRVSVQLGSFAPPDCLTRLEALPQLHSLYILSFHTRVVLVHESDHLPEIPRHLSLSVGNLPHLRELEFDTSWMTTAELDHLQQGLPQTKIISIYDGERPQF